MMLRAALWYARRGWKVFPLHGKLPAIPRGEGGRGFLDATTDERKIREWWHRWPNANVGLAAGVSGIVVIDLDPRSGGDESWESLTRGVQVPETVESLTGGGGRHFFFLGEARSGVLAPGVDIKAAGGYVVLPPSVHPNGRRYTWEASSRPGEVEVAPVPAWLAALLDTGDHAPKFEHEHHVDPQRFALGAAFSAAGMLGPELRPGVFSARCPNEQAHTCGNAFDGSTVIFAPPPGKKRGFFHCSHSHCGAVG